jgi:hypothetical protein
LKRRSDGTDRSPVWGAGQAAGRADELGLSEDEGEPGRVEAY